MHSPHQYMKHLISYMKDDSAVAIHVNREFGTKISAQRVGEVRAKMPIGKKSHDG